MAGVSDAETFLDPDASRDYLRSWKQDAERKAERAGAMAAQVEQLRASAGDRRGLAEVTVDSSGVLVDLVLTERIRRYEPDVVAQAVMSALREAQTRAAKQAREIAVEALGPDSISARVIGERMQQLLERPGSGEDASAGGRGRDQGEGWLGPGPGRGR